MSTKATLDQRRTSIEIDATGLTRWRITYDFEDTGVRISTSRGVKGIKVASLNVRSYGIDDTYPPRVELGLGDGFIRLSKNFKPATIDDVVAALPLYDSPIPHRTLAPGVVEITFPGITNYIRCDIDGLMRDQVK